MADIKKQIGKQITANTTVHVKDIKPISTDLPKMTCTLSTDQPYLLDLCTAISMGKKLN